MIFYEPVGAQDYEWVNASDERDYETLLALDGRPLGESWRPVRVQRVRADALQENRASDFPWLGAHALVMRASAVAALADFLPSGGELLPLDTDNAVSLFVLNARVIDALDEGRASITRFPGSNRIMHINRVAFREEPLRNADIFRLPHRATPTFVSQRFVTAVTTAGLCGLAFKQVWPPLGSNIRQ